MMEKNSTCVKSRKKNIYPGGGTMYQFTLLGQTHLEAIMSIQQARFRLNVEDCLSLKKIRKYLDKQQIYGLVNSDEELLSFILYKFYKRKLRIYLLASKHERKGTGSLMMEHTLMLAQKNGFSSIYLEVNPLNYPAVNFYFKHGFKIKKLLHHFYINKNHAYQMEKTLKS